MHRSSNSPSCQRIHGERKEAEEGRTCQPKVAARTLMLGDGKEAEKTDVSIERHSPLITCVTEEKGCHFPRLHCSRGGSSDGKAMITALRLIATRTESAGNEESNSYLLTGAG